MSILKKILYLGALSLVLSLSTACSSNHKNWKKNLAPRINKIAHRQLAPQPTYNRLKWVHLPEILPARKLINENTEDVKPYIFPIVHLELKNASLEEASLVLAASTRYRSYCASSIANKKITINSLGTIDELAKEIEELTHIKVVVDHHNRQLRLLGQSTITPSFFNSSYSKGLYQERLERNEHKPLN